MVRNTSWPRSGSGSVRISTTPPQLRPLSPAYFSVRMNFWMRLLPASITSRASVHTSASRQPPPTVPIIFPSGVTSILLFSLIGNDPFDEMIVDSAACSPRSSMSIAA